MNKIGALIHKTDCLVEDSKVHTFGFVLVSLIAKDTEVRGDNIEFLTDDIDGLVKPGMSVLIWPLGGWNRGLQAPMLLKQKGQHMCAAKQLIATEIESPQEFCSQASARMDRHSRIGELRIDVGHDMWQILR